MLSISHKTRTAINLFPCCCVGTCLPPLKRASGGENVFSTTAHGDGLRVETVIEAADHATNTCEIPGGDGYAGNRHSLDYDEIEVAVS